MQKKQRNRKVEHNFDSKVEETLSSIETIIKAVVEKSQLRWFSIKLFERDEKAVAGLNLTAENKKAIEEIIAKCEADMDDDSESIITNERYSFIVSIIDGVLQEEKQRCSFNIG